MKSKLIVGAAAGFVAIALSACGGGTSTPNSASASPTAPASSAAAPASPTATKPSVAATTPAAAEGTAQQYAWKDVTAGNDSPQAVTKKFMVGMYSKDVKSACSAFEPGLAATVCEPMLNQQVEAIPDGMGAMVDSMNPTISVTMSGDSAATVDLVMAGKSASGSKLKVVKTSGQWYISASS